MHNVDQYFVLTRAEIRIYVSRLNSLTSLAIVLVWIQRLMLQFVGFLCFHD